jgi:CBS domain-containing protein
MAGALSDAQPLHRSRSLGARSTRWLTRSGRQWLVHPLLCSRVKEGSMRAYATMTRDVVVVSPTVSVAAARRMMARNHVRHLPVVVGGRLVGILSDRDVLRQPVDESEVKCGTAMTAGPITCGPNTSVGRIAQLMLTHKIDCLPVINDDDVLVGLVTSSDLLSLLAERDEAQLLPFGFHLRMTDSDDALEALG